MFQGTKIHIIIQIPIIYAQKINKMMPEGPNSCIFSSKSLPPAVTQPPSIQHAASPPPARCIPSSSTLHPLIQHAASYSGAKKNGKNVAGGAQQAAHI